MVRYRYSYESLASMLLVVVGIAPRLDAGGSIVLFSCKHVQRVAGISYSARSQIVGALGAVKPPSAPTLKVLTAALSDPSPYVPHRAAETLGRLGARTPEIVSALKSLQSRTTNELAVITSSAALWE